MPTAHKKNRAPLWEPLSMCFTLYLPAWCVTGVSAASVFFFRIWIRSSLFCPLPCTCPDAWLSDSLLFVVMCSRFHFDMVLYSCIFLYGRKIMAAFVGSWPSSFYPLPFLLLYSYMLVVPSIVFMVTAYDECPPQELPCSSPWHGHF